jgi:hypothetical protein
MAKAYPDDSKQHYERIKRGEAATRRAFELLRRPAYHFHVAPTGDPWPMTLKH